MTETSPSAWTIRRASPDDAAALADFGRRAYEDAFGAFNRPEDTAVYLAESFGEPIQRAELERFDAITLLVEAEAELMGYAFVEVGPPPSAGVERLDRPVQLHRLYLDRRLHGSGVAVALMAGVQDAARELGGRSLWLSVWDINERAIAFYRKSGFVIVGSAVFTVGADNQSDHLMARALDPRPDMSQ